MNGPDRIAIGPAICHGKPVIRGTRMPVTLVVGSLAGGMTFEQVQREYDLTADDIRAALKFVGGLANRESFHPVAAQGTRFLVDPNLPRSSLALLESFGHVAEHVRDLGLGAAPDSQVAARARATGSVLLTRDLDFANFHRYPADYAGLMVLRLPDDATAEQILNLLRQFLSQTDLVKQAPGHLVIVEQARVRFRPALGGQSLHAEPS